MDDRKVMNVNKKDFFLHVFDELMDPEAEMFMYNESKTLAWFPSRVRQFTDTQHIHILALLM